MTQAPSTSAQHFLQLTPDSTAPPQYSAKTHQLMLYTLFLGARLTWQHLSSQCCRSSSDLTCSILPLALPLALSWPPSNDTTIL